MSTPNCRLPVLLLLWLAVAGCVGDPATLPRKARPRSFRRKRGSERRSSSIKPFRLPVNWPACGPDRTDLSQRTGLRGAFKVPTLRNIARTAPYFHNGRFATLREVVRFYVRRDTHPQEWYPVGVNGVEKFDDPPPVYRGNVNTTEAPYDRSEGGVPALDAQEIEDVVAFLNALTDGVSAMTASPHGRCVGSQWFFRQQDGNQLRRLVV